MFVFSVISGKFMEFRTLIIIVIDIIIIIITKKDSIDS